MSAIQPASESFAPALGHSRSCGDARAPEGDRADEREAESSGEGDAAEAADFFTEAMPHRDALYAAAMRYTRSPSDAEDLVQETFMRALSAWRRYRPGSSCKAWLLRILKNSFINHVRRRRRERRFAYESGDDPIVALYGARHDEGEDPGERIAHGELGDEVKSALASLRPAYRDVVERADLGGQGYRDIAAALGIPVGTVMSRLYRARRHLEAELSTYAAEGYGLSAARRRAA